MSKRITPDQPGKRIGAAERAKIDGPPVENTAVLAQLKAWVISHKFSCMDSLKRLLRQPFGSFFYLLGNCGSVEFAHGFNSAAKKPQ